MDSRYIRLDIGMYTKNTSQRYSTCPEKSSGAAGPTLPRLFQNLWCIFGKSNGANRYNIIFKVTDVSLTLRNCTNITEGLSQNA